MADLSITTRVKLNDGHSIPLLGFGVWQSSDCARATRWAFEAGYRHVDSASMYRNEAEVGEAFRASGLKRSDVFLTSKVKTGEVGKQTAKAVDVSLNELGLDQWDLYLLHGPTNGKAARIEGWRALCEAKKAGKIISAGVSNFGVRHLEELKAEGLPTPTINQVEVHPFCQQREIKKYCDAHKIVVQAYCPLIRAGSALEHPTLVEVAKEVDRTVAQVLIRWSLQAGYVPLPKSDNETRIKQNADVYDFSLSDAQMQKLNGLDEGASGAISWNPVDVA